MLQRDLKQVLANEPQYDNCKIEKSHSSQKLAAGSELGTREVRSVYVDRTRGLHD
jgi:hypothetical protein